MARLLVALALLLPLAATAPAQPAAPDAGELRSLLTTFLDGAGRNDPGVHERFWADDLIYTGSSGRRIGKADILKGLRESPSPAPDAPKVAYTAEDVRIQQYGDTAIVAFVLVATTAGKDGPEVARYLNSGTFLRRNGEWRVVNWQATKAAAPEEGAKKP